MAFNFITLWENQRLERKKMTLKQRRKEDYRINKNIDNWIKNI